MPRQPARPRRPTVLTVVGARPQFVKAAPLSRALRRDVHQVLVHTGQHYDHEMSASFFDELGLPAPDHNLAVGSGPHGLMTGRMLERLEAVMVEVRPDLVLVVGDTNSTLAGALAASKLRIPVAHVEAGLRSFDPLMPEEQNRKLTDHLSSLLFCPTPAAVANLRAEGVRRGVFRVGDVMLDAVLQNRARARRLVPRDRRLPTGSYYLATVHREENVEDPSRLADLVRALSSLPRRTVALLHPRTRARMQALGLELGGVAEPRPPATYLETLQLVADARCVLTDSGGLQKEAYILGTPCLTLRDTTEWVETVAAGANVLVGANPRRIARAAADVERRPRRWPAPRVYGDGRAAGRVAAHIVGWLRRREA